MTEIHKAETRLKSWVQATDSIINDNNQQNIILHIDSPEVEDPLAPEVFQELNQMYREEDNEPVHTIAEWIFPGWLYVREDIEEVYNSYPRQIETFLDAKPNKWGTYAHRMMKRKDPENGDMFNPLKTLIENMHQANQEGNQTFHSCYELGIHKGSYDIPIYDPSTDRKIRRGLPCLSHLSFKLFSGEVHLTALYRNHDYRFKVPGNLLGLARLQACVAQEVGADIGHLVVHSSRAFIDPEGGTSGFKGFISDLSEELDIDS